MVRIRYFMADRYMVGGHLANPGLLRSRAGVQVADSGSLEKEGKTARHARRRLTGPFASSYHAPLLKGSLLAVIVVLAAFVLIAGCAHAPMRHDVQTAAKPWTHTTFCDDPQAFHFAVMSDRTGGHRLGVFEGAVDKVNLLQPEFVICIGDLIEGYTEDPALLSAERQELDRTVGCLDAPFFHVPGNHDVSNVFMEKDWERRYGRCYYSFVYKNVLFLCLNAQDGPRSPDGDTSAGIGAEQAAWAKETLRRNQNVRWTFILMHQPLWLYEENIHADRGETKGYTRFPDLEEALGDRPYTVIVGHYHQYTKYLRHGRTYIILATTGGASELGGITVGAFDHVAWITMTPSGPRIANILLDGLQDENVYMEAYLALPRNLEFRDVQESPGKGRAMAFSLPVENPYPQEIAYRLAWDLGTDSPWKVTPSALDAKLRPGEKQVLRFEASGTGDLLPLPVCVGEFATPRGVVAKLRQPLPIDMESYVKEHRPTVTAHRIAQPPAIDGDLGDAAWNRPADISAFWEMRFARPKAATKAWLAYDAERLYLAVRCAEPAMDKLKAATGRDAVLWQDDSVEFMLNTNPGDEKSYYLAINCDGVFAEAYDGASFNTNLRCATAKGADFWCLELAIPWKGLGISAPAAGAKMRFELVRNRAQTSEVLQYPLLNGGNHIVRNYGTLLFQE